MVFYPYFSPHIKIVIDRWYRFFQVALITWWFYETFYWPHSPKSPWWTKTCQNRCLRYIWWWRFLMERDEPQSPAWFLSWAHNATRALGSCVHIYTVTSSSQWWSFRCFQLWKKSSKLVIVSWAFSLSFCLFILSVQDIFLSPFVSVTESSVLFEVWFIFFKG